MGAAIAVGDDDGDCAARRCISGTCDGWGVVCAVIWRFNANHWRCGVDTAVIGVCAGVAGRIGNAGRYLIAAFRERSGHIYAVTTIRLHGSSQGLLSAIGIGHHQNHRAAWNRIGSTSDSRCGVIGIVRRINYYHWRCHIHTAIVGRGAGIPRRIGHCGSDGIKAFC